MSACVICAKPTKKRKTPQGGGVPPKTCSRRCRLEHKSRRRLRNHPPKGYPRGELVHGAKLTTDKVREIRASNWFRYGEQSRLARRFGVSVTTINKIVRGRQWKHVEGGKS